VVAAVTAGALVVATVTGIWLWQGYRPVPDGVPDHQLPSQDHVDARWASDAHETSAVVAAVAGALWLATAAASSAGARRLVATGAAVAVLGGAVVAWTGPRLAWDQVALFDVTLGTEVDGLFPDEPVQSYLIGSDQVAPGELRTRAWLHVGGSVLVVVGLVTGVGFARGRRRYPVEGPPPGLRP
jgi:hypothetical protein